MRVFRASRSSPRRVRFWFAQDSGFTIVELMAALSILAVALFALAYTATAAFKYTAASRQRQQANNLANNAIESVRALPFATLAKGMSQTDIAAGVAGTAPYNVSPYSADTFVSSVAVGTCASGYRITPPGSTSPECLITTSGSAANTSTTAPSLVNYQQATSVNPGVDFLRKVYVSLPTGVNLGAGYRITVLIKPTTHTLGADAWRQFSTIIPLTSGCQSTATHPFSGPCNTFLFAQGLIPKGTVTVTPGTTLTSGLSGMTLRSASVTTPQVMVTGQSEQVQLVQGAYAASGATLDIQDDTGGPRSIGGTSVSSASDNDQGLPDLSWVQSILTGAKADTNAGSPAGSWCYPSSSCPNPAAADALPSGGATSTQIAVMRTAVDDATSQSTSSVTPASGATSCNGEADGQPCSWVSGRQTGTLSLAVHLFSPNNTDLGWCKLVEIQPPGASNLSSGFLNRTNPPADASSPKVTVKLVRSLGQVTIGCLPSNLGSLPTGWTRASGTNGTGTLGYLLRSAADFTQGGTTALQSGAGLSIASPSNVFANYGAGSVAYYFNQTGDTSGSYSTLTPTSPSSASATNPLPTSGVALATRGPGSLVYTPTAGTGFTSATGGPCTFTEQIVPGTTLLTGAASLTANPGATGTVTDSKLQFAGPLTGTVNFKVTCGTTPQTTIADLSIAVNLGNMVATTKYAPAPT